MKIVLVLFLLFGFFNSIGFSQVNTEALRKYEIDDGFYHQLGLNFGLSSGNSNYFNLKSEYRTDLKTNKFYSFLSANLEYRDANNKVIASKGFAHLRFTYYFSQFFEPELFSQLEYNKFILLNLRKLIGAGARFEIFDYTNDSISNWKSYLYLATGFMYEKEDYKLDLYNTSYIRNTNYLTYGLKINPLVEFNSTSYFQIAISKLNDFRVLNQSGLKFSISKNFRFLFNINVRYDSEPLPEIKNLDIELINGINFMF